MSRSETTPVTTTAAELELGSPFLDGSTLTSVSRHLKNTISSRRLLGAFYTPGDLATVLARWALSDGPGTILDPSYGGCAFLRAAVEVLQEHNVSRPGELVFGIDIDQSCEDYAKGLVPARNHITGDFLALRPGKIPGYPFKAIIGNPPYVRHHWLKGIQREAARDAVESVGVHLRQTASTWAYFVVHSLSFLSADGRIALVVPEAVLQTDYAVKVRECLRRRFRRVVFVHIRQRIFKGTSEPVVVIAAEGQGPGLIRVESIESIAELPEILTGEINTRSDKASQRTVANNGRATSDELLSLLDELAGLKDVVSMNDLAVITIGFVTGANKFFIRNYSDVQRMGIPSRAIVPVVTRAKWLTGLVFDTEDHRYQTSLGRSTLLVRPTDRHLCNPSIHRWITDGKEADIIVRYKCQHRDPWFRVPLGSCPDAFATCSRSGSPLLVLNRARLQCSNALHAVRWRDRTGLLQKAISVCMLTSLPAVWSELHGRRYGEGVLKLEPGTLRRIPLPLVKSASRAFSKLDALLRKGDEEQARRIADDLVLRRALGVSASNIARLQRARQDLREQRIPPRLGGTNG